MTTAAMDDSSHMSFHVLDTVAPVLAPRVGKLAIAGRRTLSTPHYISLTSRGTVPHITHDVMRDHTGINGLYAGLEDFIEKKPPAPLYKTPVTEQESPLKKFICVPENMPLILGPRRFPAIPCPPTNTETSIAVLTSVGFHQLSAHHYVEAVQKLRPDIAIGLADIVLGKPPGVKRREKMVDRTHAFTRDALDRLYEDPEEGQPKSKAAYFAPVLPLDNTQQSLYLDDLESEFRHNLSGLALYESASLTFIPESLGSLPRLLLSNPSSPHEILREISLGADLLTVPLLGASSDAGVALDFDFPVPPALQTARSEPKPLGFDLWSSDNVTDTSPLREGCECHACQQHHRAYLHHLLSAKEMTAWALIQIHNHHIMELFFAGIGESIQRGSFDEDVQVFNRVYAASLPEQTGQGPRLRGHHLPAAGPGQPRRMPRIYGRLDEAIQKFAESQSSVATPDTGAEGLEEHGFAEKA
ncbi:hypothetical protein NUU61_001989 [Penicillium alfredii]|uniref:Queuine tRNA-ribosyltransferase accessory subunit 2 n=1 Tax=Penicillium alfredii TaxID=1506179 RepID=A0A9W9KGW0_9EURO|nr:uncharacterized protein NUU61_001989 [Penicillium alfredii]KAJ5104642.1 hypothetical protein NUU61_001989 [Penicillium alfredii]